MPTKPIALIVDSQAIYDSPTMIDAYNISLLLIRNRLPNPLQIMISPLLDVYSNPGNDRPLCISQIYA